MDKKALGKGLSALIPAKIESTEEETIAYIQVSKIENNRFQPRTNYDEEGLEELKNSIKEQGILQPIIVRRTENNYEVVAGERRLRAARDLNLEEIPAVIRNLTDDEALVIALIENIQREELNPIEEAEAFQKLIDDFKFTQENVAQSVGKDRSTISNLLRLLQLPEQIKNSVYQGNLTVGHARTLLGLESTGEQVSFFDLTLQKNLSVRELENLVKVKNKGGARRERTEKPKNSQIVELEEGLQKLLGTKVRIDHQKKRGTINIEYYSLEDLDRIVKLVIK